MVGLENFVKGKMCFIKLSMTKRLNSKAGGVKAMKTFKNV